MSSASQPDDIRKGLSSFGGVKRRFTRPARGTASQIFDDYGHHPVEIKAVLRAARDACKGRVIAIAQPHRFTRLRDLFDEFSACFNDADTVMVAPVYAAGEDPIDGVNSRSAGVAASAPAAIATRATSTGPQAIAPVVRELAKPGDFVVFLGAGNITQWAYALPKELGGGAGMNRSAALFARLGDRLCAACAAASRPMPRWTRSPGSAPAASPTRCSSRPTRRISRRS